VKRLIFLTALVLVACALTAQTVYYQDEATLAWDPVLLDAQGTPWLSSDTVEYEVYVYDTGSGTPDPAVLTGWQYVGVTSTCELLMVFGYRTEWAAAVRVKVTDAGSNTSYSILAWSGNAADTQGGVPFFYSPLPLLPSPAGLRDSGT